MGRMHIMNAIESMKNHKLLTAHELKVIAAAAMFFDHFVSVFFPHNMLLNLIFRLLGRTAAPVFCFFIAQGFYYTSNLKKYIIRLLILAVISHLPYNLSFGYSFFQATSIIWPLVLGLLALTAYKSPKVHIILKLVIIVVCCALSYRANWNFIAVLWILGFGVFHGNFKRQVAAFTIIGVVHLLWQLRRYGFFDEIYPQWFQLGIFLAVPLLALFSGKPGKKSPFTAWFFYVFYPAHLILLYVLYTFTPLAEVIGRLL